jgi:hypothetical protein
MLNDQVLTGISGPHEAPQMHEFHGTRQGTRIHPGQTLNLDYSLIQVFGLQTDLRLQLGLVGYEQWQFAT